MRHTVALVRLPLLLMGMASLVAGILAGLARLGVAVPATAAAAAGSHGALMASAFFGTVISLERAVAVGGKWPYLAPLAAGLGGVGLLAGLPLPAVQASLLAAALALCAVSLGVIRRQAAAFTVTLGLGAACWAAGNLAWWATGIVAVAAPCWAAFLVLTIAGERLDLTRFLPTPVAARRQFVAIVAALLAAAALATLAVAAGSALLGAALVGLALWLLRHDIARRTLRQAGLTRYIAACLLSGYLWLIVAGGLGLAGGFNPGDPWRDACLHALFLGFVFSMVFGHAPIIVPAVAKARVAYSPFFYLPLAALHASLAARLAGDFAGALPWRASAAIANALALALFVATLLVAIARGARGTK